MSAEREADDSADSLTRYQELIVKLATYGPGAIVLAVAAFFGQFTIAIGVALGLVIVYGYRRWRDVS